MRKRRVKCVETGDVYASTTSAAEWTTVPQARISVVCDTAETANGVHWCTTTEDVTMPPLNADEQTVLALKTTCRQAYRARVTMNIVYRKGVVSGKHVVYVLRRKKDKKAVYVGCVRNVNQAARDIFTDQLTGESMANYYMDIVANVDKYNSSTKQAAVDKVAKRVHAQPWHPTKPTGHPAIDERGHVYGKLTVLRQAQHVNGDVAWLCQCECGNQVVVRGMDLRKGQRSCGCIKTKHGMANTPLYRVWIAMHSRCKNPNDRAYADYGGRGISMCEAWDNSFVAFYHDVGDPPGKGYSLDRIDVNGNYEPGNVRWATAKQQANNKRNTIRVMINGEQYTLNEVAKQNHLRYKTVFARYEKGVPPEHLGDHEDSTDWQSVLNEHRNLTTMLTAHKARGKQVDVTMYTDDELRKMCPIAWDTWKSMYKRCVSGDYFDKGITMCDRWVVFRNFVADMGEPPKQYYSLDRIDLNGGYEPSNCRWSTWTEQCNNKHMTTWCKHGDIVAPCAFFENTLGEDKVRAMFMDNEIEVVCRPVEFSSAVPCKPLSSDMQPAYMQWGKLAKNGKLCQRWMSFAVFVDDVGLPDYPDCEFVLNDDAHEYAPGQVHWVCVHSGLRVKTFTVRNRVVNSTWEVVCDCGHVEHVTTHALIHGKLTCSQCKRKNSGGN